MRVKNKGLLSAEVLLHLALDLGNLLPSRHQRPIKPRHLLEAPLGLNLVAGHFNVTLDVNKDLPIRDALRGGDALHGNFDFFGLGH